MAMTKDNWIKAFDKLAPAFDWRGYPSRTSVINFISQVEKDAIEKTNKRWREKIEGLKDECEFMESDAHDICQHCGKWRDEHYKEPGYNQALSDLLKDK